MRPLVRPAVLLALLGLVAFAGPAAADVSCTGTIGAQQIDDNVVVPSGADCTLNGTSIDGNVLVGPGATLIAQDVTVDGNIQDEGGDAGHVRVIGSVVNGNIQLEQGTSATVRDTEVGGDVQLESNTAALNTDDNDIGGNLQVNQNTGGVAINRNTIDGNLQCASNDPAPTGGDNVVLGSAEGQCASLEDGAPPSGTTRDISRLSGATRFETAVEISHRAFPGGAPVVYLARADDFPDALAAGSLSDGPILLVPSCDDIPSAVLQEIARLDPADVIALGGSAAICDAVLVQAGNA